MKKNKLSYSAIRMYSECSRKYKLHYIDRLRPNTINGALLMGNSIDRALNELIQNKNLEEAIKTFDKSFRYNFINNEGFSVPDSTNVVYAKRDFDKDLLQEEDCKKFTEKAKEFQYKEIFIEDCYKILMEEKEAKGFKSLLEVEKKLYNLANWLCLRRKGHIMLKSYSEKVLLRLKEVILVQGTTKLENSEGDVVNGVLDLVALLDDNKRYLLDNKTSSMEYESDSAARSQQLISYYHSAKDEYKLDGVGYIVLYKQIQKNKVKTCSKCGNDGTGKRHKTCDSLIENVRCNSEWIEKINPEARIEIILNEVSEAAENLVLESFDEANEGIKKEAFGPNLQACGSLESGFVCQFYNKCWKNSDEGLVKLEKKDETSGN